MSRRARDWARRQRGLVPAERLVLWYLAERADDEGLAFPSINDIADNCEVSAASVRRHLKALAAQNLLKVENRSRENGGCSSNLYRLILAPSQSDTPPSQSDRGEGVNLTGEPLSLLIGVSEPSEGLEVRNTDPVVEIVAEPVVDELRETAIELVALAGIAPASRHAGLAARDWVKFWQDRGAKPELFRAVISDVCERHGPATSTLRRFDRAMADALAEHDGPLAGVDVAAAFRPENQRAVVDLYRAGKIVWDDDRWELYGAPPGQPGCRLDPQIVEQVAA